MVLVNLLMNSGLSALDQLDLKQVVGELQKGKRKRGKEETADEKLSPKKATAAREKVSSSTAKGTSSTPQAASKPAAKTGRTKQTARKSTGMPLYKKGEPAASSPYLSPPTKLESKSSGPSRSFPSILYTTNWHSQDIPPPTLAADTSNKNNPLPHPPSY